MIDMLIGSIALFVQHFQRNNLLDKASDEESEKQLNLGFFMPVRILQAKHVGFC